MTLDLSLGLRGFEREAARTASARDFAGVSVRVPNLTSLLIYETVAGRPRDLDDARALLKTGEDLDESLVERTLAEFDAILDTDRAGDLRSLLRER